MSCRFKIAGPRTFQTFSYELIIIYIVPYFKSMIQEIYFNSITFLLITMTSEKNVIFLQ